MTRRRTHMALSNIRSFVHDADGVAAVEFAMILPFMLVLYLGSLELGNAMAVQFRTAIATRTVADLTSQYVLIDDTAMSGILNTASTVVAPYSGSSMVVTVTQITTNSSGQGTIAWSDSLNGTPRTVGQSVTLPTALQIANTTMIWSEVTYPYRPTFGYALSGTINISQSSFFYPRLSTTITRNSS
jgi:Flp pilus assembly protein TadG